MSLARPVGRPALALPGPDQPAFDLDGLELPGLELAGRGGGGYGATARAVAAAVTAAATTGLLTAADGGLARLAVELGRAVDIASAKGDARQIAAAGRELRETLTRLRLDPSARHKGGSANDPDGSGGALAGFLAGLSHPEVGNPSHP